MADSKKPAQIFIVWVTNKTFEVKRLVIGPQAENLREIILLANILGLETVTDPSVLGTLMPKAADLWVGASPQGGWCGLENKCAEARTAEGIVVLSRLYNAWLVDDTGNPMPSLITEVQASYTQQVESL